MNINEIYAQIYSVENSFENLFSTENNGTKVMDSEVKAKLERAAVKIESHENDNNNTDSNLSSLDDLAKDFIQNMDFNPFNTEQFIASLFKIKEHFSVKKFKTLTPEIVRRHIFSIMRAPHPELFVI
ncbi:MAG: hypothetical protein HWD59_06015 [Coxiellaceae bacterium]|nr:MAG: hypothetical protein HWD59_06015 [Coxiellaceae bacterium]